MSSAVRSVAYRLSIEGDQIAVQKLESFGRAGRQAIEPVSPVLKGVSAASEDVQSSLKGMASQVGAVGTGLIAMGPVGLGIAVTLYAISKAATEAFSHAKEAAEFADGIESAAQKLTLGVGAYQQISAAAKEFNIQQGTVDSQLSSLRDNLNQFIAGVGGRGSDRVFKNLGVSREDLSNAGSFENQINLIADALARIQNQGVREGLASKLGIDQLLPILGGGAQKLDELRAAAVAAGLTLDSDLVKRGADANKQWEKLSTIFNNELRTAFISLAPLLQGVLNIAISIADQFRSIVDSFSAIENKSTAGLREELANQLAIVARFTPLVNDAEARGQKDSSYFRAKTMLDRATAMVIQLHDQLDIHEKQAAEEDRKTGTPPTRTKLPPSMQDDRAAQQLQSLAARRQAFVDQLAVSAAAASAQQINAENAADVEVLRNKAGYYQALAKQADDARDAEIKTIEARRDAQIDALNKLKAEYKTLGKDIPDYGASVDKINQTAQDQIGAANQKNRAQQVQISREAAGALSQLADTIMGPLQRSLQDVGANELGRFTDDLLAVETGAKSAGAAVGDMVNSIISDISRLILQRSVEAPLAGALNSVIGDLFGGGHAAGGGARAGVTYRVNEQGGMPETFMTPGGDGTVLSSASSLNNIVQLVSRRIGGGTTVIAPGAPPKVEVNNYGAPVDVANESYDQGSNTVRVDLKKQLSDASASAVRRGDQDTAMNDRYGVKPLPKRRN